MKKEELKEEIIKRYKSGISGYILAAKFKVGLRTIYKWLEQKGIERRSGMFTKGCNSWNYQNEEEKLVRKQKLSSIMTNNNPMKLEEVRLKKHIRYVQPGKNKLISSYQRKKAIRDIGKCSTCSIVHPLIVHHKDNNRFNNVESNFLILCHNCHFLLHEKERLDAKGRTNNKK